MGSNGLKTGVHDPELKLTESEAFNEWWSRNKHNGRAIAELSEDEPDYNLAKRGWNAALLYAIEICNSMLIESGGKGTPES